MAWPGPYGAGSCKRHDGQGCVEPAQCLGGRCVDGVCCASECPGACEACSAAKNGAADGVCGPVPNGEDPDGECGSGSEASCDGAGACRKEQGQGQGCAEDAECFGGFCTDAVCCAERDCAPYRCGPGGVCKDGCLTTADCAAGLLCDAAGRCASPPAGNPGTNGGCDCTMRPRDQDDRGWLLLALALGFGARRRRASSREWSASKRTKPAR